MSTISLNKLEIEAMVQKVSNELMSLENTYPTKNDNLVKTKIVSINEYDNINQELSNGINEYIICFKDSIDDLIRSVNILVDTEEIIANGIAHNSGVK